MEARFYMCRSCRNPVLSSENYIFTDKILKTIIGENAVNVQVGDIQHPSFLTVDVSCRGCGKKLGYKFVKNVAEINQALRAQNIPEINPAIKEENFILSQFKVAIDTEQPVETDQLVVEN